MPVTPVGWCDVNVYTRRRAFTISAQIPWTKPREWYRSTSRSPVPTKNMTPNEVDRLSADVPDRE